MERQTRLREKRGRSENSKLRIRPRRKGEIATRDPMEKCGGGRLNCIREGSKPRKTLFGTRKKVVGGGEKPVERS